MFNAPVVKLRVVGDQIIMHNGRRMVKLTPEEAEQLAACALRHATRLRALKALGGAA